MELHNLSRLFKINQQTLILTKGQREIFQAILTRAKKRVAVITPTRYGKSLTVAVAVLLRAISFGEKWAIVAPSQNQAQIIMNYVIEHLFDNPVFLAQLLVDIPLEKLKREKSKTRITFRGGGEIFTQTADIHNRKRLLGALMGFGCIVGGYKIMTDKGNLPIDRVVKEKIPVKVLSYNDRDNIMEFKKIISYQENPLVNRHILEIDLGDKKFQCTNDHPVFVEGKGYIPAEEIKNGDKVLSL